MDTPAPAIETVALIFKLNNKLVAEGLAGLSDDDAWRRPGGTANPVAWLVGHLTYARASVLDELGAPVDTGWGPRFSRGSTVGDRSEYPSRAEIEATWMSTHARMREAFARATAEQLVAAPKRTHLPGATTVQNLLAFFAFHESYHVGQIGYARRLLGQSTIAG